jgi:hypothetical protein
MGLYADPLPPHFLKKQGIAEPSPIDTADFYKKPIFRIIKKLVKQKIFSMLTEISPLFRGRC